jgi:hypothetical protein
MELSMALTLDEEEKKSALVKKFGEDWELRATTREIARKNKTWYLDVCPRQHQVKIMYLWIKINWSQFSNRNLPFPMDYDNMPKAPDQPVLYALLGGWTIPKGDLNCLTRGPLYSDNWELLVPEKISRWRTALSRGWKVILGTSVAVGIVWGAYWLFNNHL